MNTMCIGILVTAAGMVCSAASMLYFAWYFVYYDRVQPGRQRVKHFRIAIGTCPVLFFLGSVTAVLGLAMCLTSA